MDELNVLILEDNLFDYNLLRSHLDAITAVNFKCDSAYKLEDAIKFMDNFKYDIILADLNVPDSFGLDTVRALTNHTINIPLVVMTSMNDVELSVKAIHSGAQDYIVKEDLSPKLLYTAIIFALERHEKLAKLIQQSIKDFTTGLFNRSAMRELICKHMLLATRVEKKFSFVIIEIENMECFKTTLKENMSNRILADSSNILRTVFRESDILIKYDFNQFLVSLICDNEEDLKSIYKRMDEHLLRYNKSHNDWNLKFNYGHIISEVNPCSEIDLLIKKAIKNMNENK